MPYRPRCSRQLKGSLGNAPAWGFGRRWAQPNTSASLLGAIYQVPSTFGCEAPPTYRRGSHFSFAPMGQRRQGARRRRDSESKVGTVRLSCTDMFGAVFPGDVVKATREGCAPSYACSSRAGCNWLQCRCGFPDMKFTATERCAGFTAWHNTCHADVSHTHKQAFQDGTHHLTSCTAQSPLNVRAP